jgi:exodeoxyribonuclease VIII
MSALVEIDFDDEAVIPEKGMVKMGDSDYFSVDAISNSDFRLLKESVLHYENKDLFPFSNPSVELGRAVHKLVLEPETFNKDFVIEEFEGCDLNKNSNAYRDAKKAWLSCVGDRAIISSDTFEKVKLMARNVKAIAGGLLQGGVAEHAFFAEFYGVKVKCKADYYNQNLGLVLDLKTTASISDFKRSILEYGYGTQSAFYMDVISKAGYKAERFVFILVESVAPYMVSVQEMNIESIEEGRAIYGEYLDTWKKYKKDGIVNVVKTTGYPEWFLEKRRGV